MKEGHKVGLTEGYAQLPVHPGPVLAPGVGGPRSLYLPQLPGLCAVERNLAPDDLPASPCISRLKFQDLYFTENTLTHASS